MIIKIKSIKNFAVFKDFNWDDSIGDFKKLNIFYGRNYSGKTTLSRIFRAIETKRLPKYYDNIEFELNDDKSKITESNLVSFDGIIRVFNEDFVREHLKFLSDPTATIDSFAILGATNIQIQEKISLLEEELGSDEEVKKTGLYKVTKDAEDDYRKLDVEHKKICDNYEKNLKYKALDPKNGIKYNSNKFGDQNYTVNKLKKDIEDILSNKYIVLSLEQKNKYEKIIQETVKSSIQFFYLEINFEKYCIKAEELLAKKIGTSNKIQELLLDAALNKWVKEGVNLLSDKDRCAFCGNHISTSRWQEIYAHFDEESKNLEKQLEELIQEIKSEQEKFDSVLNEIKEDNFYQEYIKDFQEFKNQFIEYTITYQEALNSIIIQLKKRKEQITVDINFIQPEFDTNLLNTSIEKFNKIIDKNNNYANNLDAKKKIAQKALRLDEVSQFCKDKNIVNIQENIHQLKDKTDKARNYALECTIQLKQKEEELKNIKRQLNNEEEGARRVNKYLNNYFAHRHLTLIAENNQNNNEEKSIRFRIMRGDKPAYHLSEGECSLIAFCYFIAKLEDIETFDKKPIIWIDDPISSLDSNHIYYIYSLIQAKITKDNCEQLFISTHNLDFFNYLKQFHLVKEDKKKSKKYFLIDREQNQKSILKNMPRYLINHATEFNYLFSIIYKCSQCESITDENYDMLYSFANNARKFLEMYLYFKYPNPKNDLVTNLKNFFAPEEIPPILIHRVINEGSHGVSPERMLKIDIDREIINVAKRILEKLKEHDKKQYQELLDSIKIENDK